MALLRMLRVKGRSTLVSMDMVIQNRSRCKLVCSALPGGPAASLPCPATHPGCSAKSDKDQSQIRSDPSQTPPQIKSHP